MSTPSSIVGEQYSSFSSPSRNSSSRLPAQVGVDLGGVLAGDQAGQRLRDVPVQAGRSTG